MTYKALITLLPILLMISCTNENSPEVFELIACTNQDAPVEVIKATSGPLFSNGEIVKENAGEYPELARRAQIEGIVSVSFQITKTGEPENIRVEKGIGGGADEASLNGIMDSQFAPAKFKNEPLCVKTFAQAIFDLNDPENVAIYLEGDMSGD